jgi:hypothetical protein
MTAEGTVGAPTSNVVKNLTFFCGVKNVAVLLTELFALF